MSARHRMPWPGTARPHDRGQALAEMVLLGALLIVCWHAFGQLHRVRGMALHASESARLWAFSRAAGAPLAAEQQADALGGAPKALSAVGVSAPASAARPARLLAADWLRLTNRLDGVVAASVAPASPARAQASAAAALPSRRADTAMPSLRGAPAPESAAPAARLPARRLLLATQSGSAASTADMQQRLAHSRTGWRNAAEPSLTLARRVARAGEPIDRPWRARHLTPDWLRPWADIADAGAAP